MSAGADMASMNRCASCGVKEGDDVKLKNCTACYLVKYCGRNCQKEHWPKHKRACKKRAAELRDELLFRQPEGSHHGDCPICFLPLPLNPKNSTIMNCCSKVICRGCCYANQKREIEEGTTDKKCPFCRQLFVKSIEEEIERLQHRADMNDPVAMYQLGGHYRKDGDYENAFKYLSKAAGLGNAGAHCELATMYRNGQSVENDESKHLYHNEQAAIGGHPDARYNLGVFVWINGQRERAVKHWIIGAKLGHDQSLEWLKKAYKSGLVSKDDFTAALRGHQAALDAMKNPDREDAEAYFLPKRDEVA